ncbi:Imm26 family immunity protein [Cellulophaga sp. L1A9]|uniref:Imm26 family immunity protein n=1 Tax=Cellulophaga sp. L1A9 TaxID=2686362 RepID=UPI00131AEAD1|nr:Imm26 family immunity protein [Cellulophaga sp. L1A9]
MKGNDNYKGILKAGDIFCIPLFIDPKEKATKSYTRVKYPEDKQYAFGRFIEDRAGGGVLVEVFEKTMTLKDYNQDLVKESGRLFPPVTTSGLEFTKKRWRLVSSDQDYDKINDSDYKQINLVIGTYDDLRVKNLYANKETEISEKEAEQYEAWKVWQPNQLEKRIIKELFVN